MDGVSVLIVSYRTPELTLAAARSALQSRGVAEVVVADNAPGDGTRELLEGMGDSRVRYAAEARNVGFGTAANHAAREATGGTLVFLNSDAELPPKAVETLDAHVEMHGGRCILGPRVVGRDGSVQRSAGLLPRPSDLTVRALGLHALARLHGIAGLLERIPMVRELGSAERAVAPVDTTMISGACLAIGREAFWELGGFDERFFMYFEDADLCKRAAAAGMPIRYVPSAVVTHIGGASSTGDYRFSPMHARSMRQYLEKWWGSPGTGLAILLLWLRLVGHALVLHPGTGKAFAALRAALRP